MLFYNIEFDTVTHFPKILESIKVDSDLRVYLQYNGIPIPLPQWFIQHSVKMTKIRMLENFTPYIRRSQSAENYRSIFEQLRERQFYKPKGRPPYSADIICYALHLRYTSLQGYKLVLEKFPMPSISLLNKIQQGGVIKCYVRKYLE